VKFLIKIEESINNLILNLLEKLKGRIPHFVFNFIAFLKHLPSIIKGKISSYIPQVRIVILNVLGSLKQVITMLRGYFVTMMIYFRSEEFKKSDKKKWLLIPVFYSKNHPFIAFFRVSFFAVCIISGIGVVQNVQKIIVGTSSLRKPASSGLATEDIFIEIKNHKFEVKLATAGGGHGSATAGDHKGDELFLDISIEANNIKDKEFLEKMVHEIDHKIETLELHVDQLPLSNENKKKIEEAMILALNTELSPNAHYKPIKEIKVKQVLASRPVYYRQIERMLPVTDINLQIFLENTNRNRQVWIDFTILASNRNVILYLKDHEVEFKDHLSTNVEPVIPQLPVEEEGRLIIKDKMKMELNIFLEKNGIEGKVLEVYIDYLMAT
jgi:hypothetical protein